MKPWYWHKMLKLSDSAGKKLKLPARGFAAAGSFNFFRPNWQFQHFSQITVSWNYPKIQLWHWNCHKKLSFLLSVSSETDDKKKKRTRFPVKTGHKKKMRFLPKTQFVSRSKKLVSWAISPVSWAKVLTSLGNEIFHLLLKRTISQKTRLRYWTQPIFVTLFV